MSVTYKPLGTLSFTAGAALTKQIFIGVTSGIACGLGAKPLGVLELDVASGKQGTAINKGTALVKAGAAVSKGAKLQSDASGKAITYSSGVEVGYALNAAAAADELIEVLLS